VHEAPVVAHAAVHRAVGVAAAVINSGVAVEHAGEMLSRLGESKESAKRLGIKAAEAEVRIGIHGVSVTAGQPTGPASAAATRCCGSVFSGAQHTFVRGSLASHSGAS
jgi:hypothetical protein